MITLPATAGMLGFDTDQVITLSLAASLKSSNFSFALRYISLEPEPRPGDLSVGEIEAILDARLALGVVQHCCEPGWLPSGPLGEVYGSFAANNLVALNLPVGITVWLDFEECSPATSEAAAVAYVNNWAQVVAAAGYQPGVYVGAGQPLSGDVLYWRLLTTRYWQSGSSVPAVPYRGYCMRQAPELAQPVAGVTLDRDIVTGDMLGGFPVLAAAG
jgi:hypothetical protein